MTAHYALTIAAPSPECPDLTQGRIHKFASATARDAWVAEAPGRSVSFPGSAFFASVATGVLRGWQIIEHDG